MFSEIFSSIRASKLSPRPSDSGFLDESTLVDDGDQSKLPLKRRHVPGPLRFQQFILSIYTWCSVWENDRREQYHREFELQWWMLLLPRIAFFLLLFWAVPLVFVFVWRHGSLPAPCSGLASFDDYSLPPKVFSAQMAIIDQELPDISMGDPGLKSPFLDVMIGDPTCKYLESRLRLQTRKLWEFNPTLSRDLGEIGSDLLNYRMMHNNLTNGICTTQDLATEAMVRFSEVLLPALGRDDVAELTSLDMLGLPIIPAVRILNRLIESPYILSPNIFEFEVQNAIKTAHQDFRRSISQILDDRADVLSSISRELEEKMMISVTEALDSVQRQRTPIPAPNFRLRDLLPIAGRKEEARKREEYLALLSRIESTLLDIQDAVRHQSAAIQELQLSDHSLRSSIEPYYNARYSRRARKVSVPVTLQAEALTIPHLRRVDGDARYYDYVMDSGANVTATRFITDLLSLCNFITKRDVVAVAFQPLCNMWVYFRDASTSTSDAVGISWTSKKNRARLWWNVRNNDTTEGTLKFLVGQKYYKHEAAARQLHLDQNRQALQGKHHMDDNQIGNASKDCCAWCRSHTQPVPTAASGAEWDMDWKEINGSVLAL